MSPRISTSTVTTVGPVAPGKGRLQPLGLDEVTLTGGFWAQRQHVNATATLPHIEHWLEREGWIANFDLAAAGQLPAGRRGREFADSEVYKYLEALAWEIGRSGPAEALEQSFTSITARIAAAQEPDGYLNTMFGRPGQAPRWSALEWGHELYCTGHLLQAAVARARTRPGTDDLLVQVARRAADLVCDVFGPGGIEAICGHPEIEPALAEFARVTGDERYLAQAALFVERRGHGTLPDFELGRAYYQDDLPVRAATVLRGHAVRAGYLAAGAVDVAVEQDDQELLDALATQWDNTVARRTYLTGGQGSHHQDEAFGEDWVLPPDRSYSETCAAVASIMFSWRLLLAQGAPRYADLIERTLFNVVATSPSTEGTAFFYANTLHRRQRGTVPPTDVDSPRADSGLRAPWFAVSCCPTNVARTLASLAGYMATTDDHGLQLHQYADAEISTELGDGRAVALRVRTGYPDSGVVVVRIARAPGTPWTLSLRVPDWASGAAVIDPDGVRRPVPSSMARITRVFRAGDEIRLQLPFTPRWLQPDPRIDALRGTVAVQRGPLVYCAESPDLPDGRDVDTVRVDQAAEPRYEAGRIVVSGSFADHRDTPWPYRPLDRRPPKASDRTEIALVPYHSWANRGPSTMRVWLPTDRGR